MLTPSERAEFLSNIGNLKVPSGYSGSMRKHVVRGKLQSLKSHDMYVLCQQILPMALRHVLHDGPRAAIIRLSVVFQRICAKVIYPAVIPWLGQYVAETLCMLEVWFPPSFWDIMSHLVIHLVDELAICGLVSCRWMYPIERYLGVLKKYVQNRSLPEGCMAEGYIIEEALGLCTECLQRYTHTQRQVWDDDEEEGVSGVQLQGRGTSRRMGEGELRAAHLRVITNSAATESLYREWVTLRNDVGSRRAVYRATHIMRRGGHARIEYPVELAAIPDFARWLQKRVHTELAAGRELTDEVQNLAFPPSPMILNFGSCTAYGNHFITVSGDVERGFTTCDNGIALIALQGSRTSTADRNVIEAELSYVGVLREILQLHYNTFPVVMFRGSWVPPDQNGNTSIKCDKYGFWLANFNRRQHATLQPYAFPAQVKQVFFANDTLERGWKVVLQKESRSVRVLNAEDSAVLGATPVNEELDAARNVLDPGGLVRHTDHADEVVPQVLPGAIRVRRALRRVGAWEGAWSSGESNSASDHDCDAEEV